MEISEAKKRATERSKKRAKAIKENGNLPYSFNYKIRNAFIGQRCPICGERMGVTTIDECGIALTSPIPTIQHNIPISKGGTNTIDNISVICRSCNSSIRDIPTGSLNNAIVRKVWQEIQNELHQT